MSVMQSLEKPLEDINAGLPALPKSGKDALAKALPWLSLLGGIFTAWSAYQIWHWVHAADDIIDYANRLSSAFGGPSVASNRWSFGLYISLGVLIISAVIYFLAVSPLRAFKKAGWDLLFLAIAVNFLYGIVVLFANNYGGFGSLVGQVITTALSLYLLFQVRDYYTGKAKVTSQPITAETPKNPDSSIKA